MHEHGSVREKQLFKLFYPKCKRKIITIPYVLHICEVCKFTNIVYPMLRNNWCNNKIDVLANKAFHLQCVKWHIHKCVEWQTLHYRQGIYIALTRDSMTKLNKKWQILNSTGCFFSSTDFFFRMRCYWLIRLWLHKQFGIHLI